VVVSVVHARAITVRPATGIPFRENLSDSQSVVQGPFLELSLKIKELSLFGLDGFRVCLRIDNESL
jgi:hypothetical protein